MSTITTRAGKGSPLTNSEVDQNFTNLNNDKLESVSESDVTQHQAALSITESQISDLDKYTQAEVDALLTSLEAYDQSLNTTDDVAFSSVQLTGGASDEGTLSWNTSDKTVEITQGDVTLQLGQEIQYTARNATGSTIGNGTFLGFSGVTVGSNRIEVSPFDVATMGAHLLVGFATEDISNGTNGKVTSFGYVRGLDTRGDTASNMAVGDETWAVGDLLYVHPTADGKLTTTAPTSGLKAAVGVIMNRHATAGEIFVRVTTLDENAYDNYGSWTISDGTNSEAIGSGQTLNVVGSGATSASYNATNNTLTISSTDNNTVYTHPTYAGDDINLDTGALSGATVISDLDFNVTTDTQGHVTDANATYSTRNLTASDVGALPITGGTLSGSLGIQGISNSFKVGDISGDNYTEIKHTGADGYGFDFQHNNASVVLNQQGTTNEVIVLGDVDSNSTTTLFGIGHSTNGGSTWSKKLNYTGAGELYIGGSGTSRAFHDGYHPNADKWTTARTLSLTGDVTGSVSWDGSGNASLSATVADDSHNHTWNNIDGGSVNDWSSLRLSTGNGYIDFGPANTSHAHIYTDRPNFYFNKQLLVNGSTVWNSGNDGSGSGLDADTVDGLHESTFARKSANANMDMNGYYIYDIDRVETQGENKDVKFAVWEGSNYGIGMTSGVTYGALNDYAMTFCMNNDSDRGFWWGYSGQSKSAGAMSLTTAGHLTVNSEVTVPTVDVSGSVQIGSEVILQESSDRADLLQITSSTSSWAGLQIRNSSNEGRWSFMTDGESAGIYNDEDNQWQILFDEGGATKLYYDGGSKLQTTSSGINVSGNINDVTDIYLADQIIHVNDTNTYMQFHAGDQWRVVTGGSERLEVNNSNTTVSNNLVCNGGINVGDPLGFTVNGFSRPHIPWAGNYFDTVNTTYFNMSTQGYLNFNAWDINGMASDLTIDIDIDYYDLSGGGSTVDHVFYFYVRNATSVSFPNCLLDSSVVAPSGTGLYAVCINSISSPLVTMIGDYS